MYDKLADVDIFVHQGVFLSFSDEEEAKKCEASHKVLYPKTKIVPLYKHTTTFGVPAELTVEFVGMERSPRSILQDMF